MLVGNNEYNVVRVLYSILNITLLNTKHQSLSSIYFCKLRLSVHKKIWSTLNSRYPNKASQKEKKLYKLHV